jgi:dihydrofolate synthase/folylpolyglutamate synthase
VIDRPLATVITPVSFDHADYLGDSVAKIATEKAGIVKPGVPVIVAAQPPEARPIIERAAARAGAPARFAGEDWTTTEERGRLVYQDDAGLLDLPAPRLPGRHQFENAGLAIAALRALPALRLTPGVFEAVAKAEWPARMQRLSHGKLLGLLPTGSELWLDGGHNADGGRAVANALADLEERVSRPLVLVVGMLASKDAGAFLRNFSGLARRLIAVPISDQQKSLPADTIADLARAANIPAQACGDIESAFAEVGRLDLDPPRVMITGSLYLAGAVLKANGTPPT